MNVRPTWKDLLKKEQPLLLPCAHDALSARLIERAGFSRPIRSAASRWSDPATAFRTSGLRRSAKISAGVRDIMGARRAARAGRRRHRLWRRQERHPHGPGLRGAGRVGDSSSRIGGTQALRPHGRQGCDPGRRDGDETCSAVPDALGKYSKDARRAYRTHAGGQLP